MFEKVRAAHPRPLRVLLVDDHVMVLAGLKAMLAKHAGRIRIIGQATEADEAERLVRALDPDVVMCDIRLGADSGLELCRRLLVADPARKVVFLTVYDDEQYLFQALRAGASGYLLKQVDSDELVRYLGMVATGHLAIDPMLAARAAATAARLRAGEFWPGAHLGLTQRESEVLGLMVSGLSNRDIASHLVLGEQTVKSHIRAVYRKMAVNDRAAAVTAALREGLFQ
jgi:DNA-binding NarL/FixJ family response regulator